jgi:hypothetical protein
MSNTIVSHFHLYLVYQLRISEVMPPLSLCALMAFDGEKLPFVSLLR